MGNLKTFFFSGDRVIVLVSNCFCIENYVNKIKENLLGKSIILGPVVSFFFFFDFSFSVLEGWNGIYSAKLNSADTKLRNHIHLDCAVPLDNLRMFYAIPTSTLDKFKDFLRAIKAVYFMLNILNPRNNTTNCSALLFPCRSVLCSTQHTHET